MLNKDTIVLSHLTNKSKMHGMYIFVDETCQIIVRLSVQLVDVARTIFDVRYFGYLLTRSLTYFLAYFLAYFFAYFLA